MKTVTFTYQQHAVVTVATTAEVPDNVAEASDEDVIRWLLRHRGAWSEDEKETDTDFGSVINTSLVLR